MAVLFVLGTLVIAGCGGRDHKSPAVQEPSPLDTGPRAGGSPVDEGLSDRGAVLFKSRTCSSCHAFGSRITGPDLKGVTHRRSAAWLEQQILHPDAMAKQDPISKALREEYAVEMPNLRLEPEEARALIEYMKRRDRDVGSPSR